MRNAKYWKRKRRKGRSGGAFLQILLQVPLAAYAIVVILPILWLVSSSLKTDLEIFTKPWALPAVPQWGNFGRAWVQASIGRYFLNSVLVTVISVALILLISAMAAYVLARFVFRGRSLLHNTFLFGMMFPVFLGIVPLYLLLSRLRMLDNYFGLITVYVAYSLSFTIFVLTGFFKTLPGELAEAGLIDGCSQIGVFFRIMLPLAKPGLITAGIFNLFGIWNEYPLALVIIANDRLWTLPLGLAKLTMQQQYETDYGALCAALVIVTVPVMVAYVLFQRKITAGLTAGALKG
jgi:N-acetylglucosamine transport system permease protein